MGKDKCCHPRVGSTFEKARPGRDRRMNTGPDDRTISLLLRLDGCPTRYDRLWPRGRTVLHSWSVRGLSLRGSRLLTRMVSGTLVEFAEDHFARGGLEH